MVDYTLYYRSGMVGKTPLANMTLCEVYKLIVERVIENIEMIDMMKGRYVYI